MKSNKKITKVKQTQPKKTDFYRDFEERFRGTRADITSRLQVYLPFVEPLKTIYAAPIALDLGCGRGEWLELLQNNGFKAKGVDLDEGMLSACHELNLDVQLGDALDYLRGLEADSLSVVSAFHVVEHIAFETLRELTTEAYRVLKPGGLLILETPNSENLMVGTSSFYLDPTHQRPLPAPLLSFVVEYEGFVRVSTMYLQESPDLATAKKTTLMNVLNGVSPDYAVVAQKNAPADILALFDTPFNLTYGIRLDTLASSYDQQVELRVAQVEEKTQLITDKLENELDPMEQKIDHLNKNVRRLELDLLAEQQNAGNLTTQLDQKNEENNQLKLHGERRKNNAIWLQNEWDATKQRIEELSKNTGQLETELAVEQQKAESFLVQLSQANEQNAHLQTHAQWLQNEWDATKQRIEELSISNGQLETELAVEQQKAESFLVQLSQANEQNAHLQTHAQWLQNEWDAAKVKIDELNHSSHHWWTVADGLNQDNKTLYISRSWRITKPLRLLSLGVSNLFKGLLAIPKGIWWVIKWLINALLLIPKAVWWLFKWPFKLILSGLMRYAVKRPALKSRLIACLRNYPKVYAHTLQFARAHGIIIGAMPYTTKQPQSIESRYPTTSVLAENTPDLTTLSPRARRIYLDLKEAMDSNIKENS